MNEDVVRSMRGGIGTLAGSYLEVHWADGSTSLANCYEVDGTMIRVRERHYSSHTDYNGDTHTFGKTRESQWWNQDEWWNMTHMRKVIRILLGHQVESNHYGVER